jgi:hypothetical protein
MPLFLISFWHCKMNNEQGLPDVYVYTHLAFSLGDSVCTLIHTTTAASNCLPIHLDMGK